MDFGSLLYAAQKNERDARKEPVNVYRTTFAPPKKEMKESKSLSVNIQKFLARKEEEERRRQIEEKKKRDELLALRSQDGKAKKRVAAMLKRTKAANRAVIDDAVDNDNTAVTIGGPAQPDEDDYGYVSQEASAYYAKLMDKYNSAPQEEPLFSQKPKKGVVKDLNSTKDRVRNALLRAEEEEMMPHKRKRKSKDKPDKQDEDTGDQTISFASSDRRDLVSEDSDDAKKRPESKQPKQRKPAPPPMDFNELLKIAQQKQLEPVTKTDLKAKVKEEDEPERPMTKRQRLEYERELEARRKREERDLARQKALKERLQGGTKPTTNAERSQGNEPGRIPKLNREDSGNISHGRIQKTVDKRQERQDSGDQPCAVPKVNRENSFGTSLGKIPKAADRDERRDSGVHPGRTSTLNREELSSVTVPKMPKVDGREEKQNSFVQPGRIPKLNREDSFSASQGKFSKNNDSKRDEKQDSLSRTPKTSVGESKPRMPKTNDIERREDMNSSRLKRAGESLRREEKIQQGVHRSISQAGAVRDDRIQQQVPKDGRERFEKSTLAIQKSSRSDNTTNMSRQSDDRGRRESMPSSREKSDVRSGTGQQGRQGLSNGAFANGNASLAFSKKMQDSLSSKFQARKDVPDTAKLKRGQESDLFGDSEKSNKPLGTATLKAQKSQQYSNHSRELEKKNTEQRTPGKPYQSQKPGTNVVNASRMQDYRNGVTNVSRIQNSVSKDGKSIVSRDGRPAGQVENRGKPSQLPNGKVRPGQQSDIRPRQLPPADVKTKKMAPSEVRPRQFPPPDVRPRQFPPADVRKKPKLPPVKRRIEDSDEDEYDSELDDFIDDGPVEDEDYSKHIREIFGYDKSRYANIDDEDDECMEANFAQVLKEEFVSTKMGILEDLEDIKKEQEEKRRKAMMKKRKLK